MQSQVIGNPGRHARHDRDGVRHVPLLQPLSWLSRGWNDLLHHKMASIVYGLLVAAMGWLILAFGNHPYFIAAAVTGFLLVGPILSTGVCELSRRHARRESEDFDSSLNALSRSRDSLLRFSAVLLVIGAVWFALSTIILQWAFGGNVPPVGASLWDSALRFMSATQLTAYVAAGGVLAVVVLALSVVAVPLLIDREDVDATDAMRTSAQAFFTNLPAMVVWGALIVALIAVGFLTGMLGLIVIFPLLGHATWYAYEDMAGEGAPD